MSGVLLINIQLNMHLWSAMPMIVSLARLAGAWLGLRLQLLNAGSQSSDLLSQHLDPVLHHSPRLFMRLQLRQGRELRLLFCAQVVLNSLVLLFGNDFGQVDGRPDLAANEGVQIAGLLARGLQAWVRPRDILGARVLLAELDAKHFPRSAVVRLLNRDGHTRGQAGP